jgi:PBP1b-binding outer membrane lipoprotein LpoB
MKKMQVVLVLLGSAALLAGGCSKGMDGSSYNYASGNLTAMLSADVQKSYDASLKAVDELQLPRSENVKDALGAKIVAKTSADKKVTITLARVSDTLTNLTIEVGMTGDKATSNAIYTKIMENLKKP